MTDEPNYTMLIQWPDDDQAFLVTLPAWEERVFGPVTHGDTYEAAARNGLAVIELLIESAIQHGEPLPRPRYYGRMTA